MFRHLSCRVLALDYLSIFKLIFFSNFHLDVESTFSWWGLGSRRDAVQTSGVFTDVFSGSTIFPYSLFVIFFQKSQEIIGKVESRTNSLNDKCDGLQKRAEAISKKLTNLKTVRELKKIET